MNKISLKSQAAQALRLCRVNSVTRNTRQSLYIPCARDLTGSALISQRPRGYHGSSHTRLQHEAPSIKEDLQNTGTKSENTQVLETLNIHDIDAPHTGIIRVVSLNRPKARNALSKQMIKELNEQLDVIYDEGPNGKTRVLILASELDNCFCAGADLKERRGMSLDQVSEFLASLRRSFRRLEELPIPTIAAVASVALGGGLEIALCTDIRVFSSNVVVGLPEVRLAIIPGAGGTYRLPAIVGEARARDMILTGRRLDGVISAKWGLCNYLVAMSERSGKADGNPEVEARERAKMQGRAREAVLAQSIKVAEHICEGAPLAVRAALQALKGESEEAENRAYDSLLHTKDRVEALEAFGAKPARKPMFKGH